MNNPLVFTVFADLHYKEGMYSIGADTVSFCKKRLAMHACFWYDNTNHFFAKRRLFHV